MQRVLTNILTSVLLPPVCGFAQAPTLAPVNIDAPQWTLPGTIFYIGSDLTKGVGPDSLSIYVRARADLSALLAKLIPTSQQ